MTDLKTFEWTPEEGELKRTTLYDEHAKLTKRLVPFAGWEMPVWYGSALEEHRTVRETCALFDVSHMGVFEISGEHARDFIDLVTTNDASTIHDGESLYAFMADPGGHILDDTMIYRMSGDRYLMVVNAGNEDKDWAWLNHVDSGEALLDPDDPDRKLLHSVNLRDLKDRVNGDDCRVDLALQGPRALDILLTLMDGAEATRLGAMPRKNVGEFFLAGLPVVISRTGYTGEEMSFEIYVHPEKAPQLWNTLLEAGADVGLKPAGLASRDSTRTEYGLPLYGHELEGPLEITPGGAGLGSYVKFSKPFFVGKTALQERERKRTKQIVRFAIERKGVRPVRPNDPVALPGGSFIGHVTSCVALPDGGQVGLAYVDRGHIALAPIHVFALKPGDRRKGPAPLETLPGLTEGLAATAAVVVDRFPQRH